MTTSGQVLSHIRNYPRAFWVVISTAFINQLGNMAFVFLMLYLTLYLKFTLPQASFTLAVFGVGMLSSGIVGGLIIDRFGPAQTMIFALFATGFIMLLFPLFHQKSAILSICLFWGFAFALYRPASQTLISALVPASAYRITFSIYRLAFNLGLSIGPALGGYIATHSFTAIFIINGIINIAASIAMLIGLIGTIWLNKPLSHPQHKTTLGFRWLKEDFALRLFLLGFIPIAMVFSQYESTLPLFLTVDLNFSLVFYGSLFTISTLLIVFFELPLNIATLAWSPRTSLMLGSAFIAIGFSGLLFAATKAHIIILAVCWTIGEMLFYPTATSYIAELAPPSNRGSYMSLYSVSNSISLLLGPWAGGLIMHQFSANGLWIACGIWGAIPILILAFLPRVRKSSG
jgi:predicted MFS family arabinose efflux permease